MAFTKLEPKSVNTSATFTFANANIAGNLDVNGKANLGSVSNVVIEGGAEGQILSTDGLGQLSWVDYSGGSGSGGGTTVVNGFAGITKDSFTASGSTATFTLSETPASVEFISVNIDGVMQQSTAYSLVGSDLVFTDNPVSGEVIEVTIYSVNTSTSGSGGAVAGFNTQVQFNDNGELGATSRLTFNKSTSTLFATHLSGEGSLVSNVNATTLDGFDSTAFATSVQGGKADSALQPSALNGYATETYVNDAISTLSIPDITGYATESYVNTQVSNLVASAPAALDTLNELAAALNDDASFASTVTTALGNKLDTSDFDSTANTWYYSKTVSSLVVSEVGDLIAGGSLAITEDYSNVMYPGGIFTITQLPPVTITLTNTWENSNTAKDAYTDFEQDDINTSNVLFNLTITGSTFDIKPTDDLTIGSTVIDGTELISLGVNTNGGMFEIPSVSLNGIIQTNLSTAVTANITTTRGLRSFSGNTLTTIQPSSFNVDTLSGAFTNQTVPFWDTLQTFSWSASNITGSVISGNVVYNRNGGGDSGVLTTTGATSGTSEVLDSAYSYVISSSDYTGSGLNGAGTRTIPEEVSGVVIAAAAAFYPLFWKTTNNSDNPMFDTTDEHGEVAYAVGQGAETSGDPADYLWIAVPGTSTHTFEYIYFGYQMIMTPDVTYLNELIGNHPYNVYGFTSASAILTITVKT